ncbi:MAG TPA: transcription antitermination factor NusB [Candidatus Ruania gallistercoris]|uniref:Transcription antitermination protein NusB n=1 Tax=Candidatus Ruania gallistercoris TaxID=2838746 RepID=A0A9D2EJ81_9MICO|nr:transcription antitermination factor NusB [Candidatus Ruania gallistercoris]
MPARTRARKRAVDVLYEADQRAGSTSSDGAAVTATSVLAERLLHPGAQTALPAYAVEIVEGVAAHSERIDEVLATFSQGWTLERMPAVDRAILRMGTWEVLYNADVDDPVAIDEAVTLAKELSTDESPNFVNGLLARIADLGSALVE